MAVATLIAAVKCPCVCMYMCIFVWVCRCGCDCVSGCNSVGVILWTRKGVCGWGILDCCNKVCVCVCVCVVWV